jgi:hypothetical protein
MVTAFVAGGMATLGAKIASMADVFGLASAAGNKFRGVIAETFGEGSKSIKVFDAAIKAIPTTFAYVAGAVSTFVIAFAVASYQVFNANQELNKQLITQGAILGKTREELESTANSMTSLGITAVAARGYIGDMLSSGISNFTNFKEATEAAITRQKLLGISVEDTAKLYKDLGKDSVDTLVKVAVAEGNISIEQIRRIEGLIKQKKYTEATTEAQDILTSAVNASNQQAIEGLTEVEKLWMDIKKAINESWGALQVFANESGVWKGLRNALNWVRSTLRDIVIHTMGFAGSFANLLDPSGMERHNQVIRDMLADSAAEYEKTRLEIENGGAKTQEVLKAEAEQRKKNSEDAKRYSQEEKDRKKALADANKETERLLKAFLKDNQALIDMQKKELGQIEQLSDARIKYNAIVASENYSKYSSDRQKELKTNFEIAESLEIQNKLRKQKIELEKNWLEIQNQFAYLL